MVSESLTLWGLFFSAFLSSTLLPGSSEVLLVTLLHQENHDPWLLVSVATSGNTLGGMSTWGIGRIADWWAPLGRLPKESHRRAIRRVQQWGSPGLLFSWLPVVGDSLCLAAGWLRINWVVACLFMAVGKAARYAVIVTLL